jgi:hypothetical protein
MENKFLRIAQIDMYAHVSSVEYLESVFKRLSKYGYNAVLLCYRDKFPYTCYPELASPDAYTLDEVMRIESIAEENGIEIIPLAMQFSHAEAILKHPRFKHLSSGGLNLLEDASLEVIVRCAEDVLRVHPNSKLVHFGGDEMQGIASDPACGRYIRENGASEYYVQFVNRIADSMRGHGIRAGIWSDMLIRYPQALPELDKSTVIFYWDYWSYGDRTPFVTIGGGLPDMFMLDFEQLHGDLRKLFITPWVHPPDEIPCGHMRRFEKYWQMDPEKKSIRSFPYLAWFREHGLDVIGSMTTYPEKSSFLPDCLSKFDHVRGFASRIRESGGTGYLACLWAKFFPMPETCMPSWATANEIIDHPEKSDDEICAAASVRLGGFWTPNTLKAYLGAGGDFEAADLISPLWKSNLALVERFKWLGKSGELENDMEMCRASLARIEALLGGEWKDLPVDSYERFTLEDLRWRAKTQIAWNSSDASAVPSLRKELAELEARFPAFLNMMYRKAHHEDIQTSRYKPWSQLLDDIETGGKQSEKV